MKQRPLLIPLLFAIWMLIVALACNLTSDSRPPTLVRATNTPPPTIGYATLAPNQLPQQTTLVPQQQTEAALLNLMNQVQMENLSSHVTALESFYSRHVNSPQNDPLRGVGAAAHYIQEQFNQIRANSYQNTFSVFTHEFPVVWGGSETRGMNVVGYIQGTETGRGVIIIGAHYDSISVDSEDGNAYAPGANDNGSGIAALLEIARIMSQRPHRSTIMFIAFGAEEVGRQGSTAFVNDYVQGQNIDLRYMINMDIIGSSQGANGAFTDDSIRLFSADPNDSASRQLARNLNLCSILYVPDMTITVEQASDRENRYSDHISFYDAGYAAVRFTEALENPNLQHTDRDRWTEMRPGYLTRATRTILACTTLLSDGPRPPQNLSLRPNANGTRTLVWDNATDAVSYLVALRAPNSPSFNQTFPVSGINSGEWDKFTPQYWESVAVAAVDANGLMGPVSLEWGITN